MRNPSTAGRTLPIAVCILSIFLRAGLAWAEAGSGGVAAGEFDEANAVIREACIAYGNKNYDSKTGLVLKAGPTLDIPFSPSPRPDVVQGSIEYAAALFDTGQNVERANRIVETILRYQWTKPGNKPWQEGNFIWWTDQAEPRDANGVVFLTPWLCYVALECDRQLTPDNRKKLSAALQRCVTPIIKHPGEVWANDNHWLLRAAGLVALSQALKRPELLTDAEKRVDEWFDHVCQHGISEFNSPCYAAVSIYAFEWIYRFAPRQAAALREKATQALDLLYADVFMQWHWEAGIAAGTHSRAYARDAETGECLVAALLFKQCGAPQRFPFSSFDYVFAVNNYRVPDPIRALARKQGYRRCGCAPPIPWVKRSVGWSAAFTWSPTYPWRRRPARGGLGGGRRCHSRSLMLARKVIAVLHT